MNGSWGLNRICYVILTLILLPSPAWTGQFAYVNAYDFATTGSWSQFLSNNQCQSPTCSFMTQSSTAPANSSDYAVGQEISMANLADGEVATWKITTPNGSGGSFSLTWNQASGCFLGSDGSAYWARAICSPG